jgi:Flp pilus assembly protein TadD
MPTLTSLEKLLAADPQDPFLLYGIAQEHAKLGHTDLAVSFYDRCLQADPGYSYAYYHKAVALERAGRMHEARVAAQAGLATAVRVKDAHAASELQSLLESME